MSGIAIDVFLWADPDISIALVPSTESLGDFGFGFWIIAENKPYGKKNKLMIL